MTDQATIQAALEERLKELTARADKVDEDLSQPAEDDWDDNAIESEGDEVLEGVGRATMEEISHIRRALAALRDGTYGTCANCGATIAPERLEALPEATKCKRCA